MPVRDGRADSCEIESPLDCRAATSPAMTLEVRFNMTGKYSNA
jgi:hypothetical protein